MATKVRGTIETRLVAGVRENSGTPTGPVRAKPLAKAFGNNRGVLLQGITNANEIEAVM